ncbi:related to mitochondrial ribosomal protein L2 of the large subunit [Serendipita indica DSM 11827]|uniref:Large ribosomal subunit protein uL2m n=1 Tax=Serendipita indica (strain DSM 11827) TaxID=1109443 RepID=G4TE12_SERID|nr:related to mitochondrial ribosomal protein L2 of the large subunit [Serendipita indica DSM 11827]
MLRRAVTQSCVPLRSSHHSLLLRTYATAVRASNGSQTQGPPPTGPAKRKRNTANPLVKIVDGFKKFKPITPGLRHVRMLINPHLWKGKPVRDLTFPLRKKGGRNNTGQITVRSRGGGHKRRIRIVDFYRREPGPHDVIRIEYDPNRSAHIALLKSRDKNALQPWSYILACEGLRAGDVVTSYRGGIPDGTVEGYVDEPNVKKDKLSDAELGQEESSEAALSLGILRSITIKLGNVLPLRLIPPGTVIHNITLDPKGPARLVRSAGTSATMVLQEEKGEYCQIRLQSGEVRRVRADCCATIGKVSNGDWKGRMLGKAGRARWLGRRPHVRGVAMNARDHPHGGGRGKSKGNRHPSSPWGWNTKGKRTRKPGPRGHKTGNKYVIRERPRGKHKISLIVK